MEHSNYAKAWLTVIGVVLVVAFAFQGSRGLWEPDEGRYVRCAYEMQKTGDWVTPQINFKPHFTKPPMTYWLIASGLSLFGRNDWGARFFHGVAFALTALMVGFMGKRMWDDRTGLMASLVYATSVLPFIAGNAVTTDTILVFFETLAVLCFWMSVSGREHVFKSSLWAVAMWFFFGLAFLTKGPPSLLPLGAILVYLLVLRKVNRLPVIVTVFGLVVFVVVSLSWFVAVVREHEDLLSFFFKHEFVGRVFTGEHRRNSGWLGPFKVYLPILTVGALPWACSWPVLLRRSRPRILTLDWWRRLRERPVGLFLVMWFGVPLLIFCLVSSRLPLYLLPLFAPLALATARGLVIHFPEKTSSAFRLRGTPGVAVAALVLVLVGSKFVAAHVPWKRDSRAMWNGMREAIQERVGDKPYEIVLIHENYDGLAFYSDTNVEYLMTDKGKPTSPTFSLVEYIGDEYDELASTQYEHVFLVRERKMDNVLPELKKRGIRYSMAEAPFDHKLIFCKGSTADRVIRLAALGDAGTGDSVQTMIGSTLYHVDQEESLNGIILLGDNVVGWHGGGKPTDAYREYFEKPYAPLLSNHVPFYAALGNHDLNHEQMDFQIHYPYFNMHGRRYYSKVFGGDVVEVFFLDSNTIVDDAEQVAWLKQALGQSTARWKVVAMHHPLYSTSRRHRPDTSLIQLLEPIFVEHGVDIVLAGHRHVYERLSPIKGIQYIIDGSGGKLREGSLNPDDPRRVAGNDRDRITLLLQFEDGVCRFTAYTLNEEIEDEGEILKASPHNQPATS